jgi:hypothetical protein
VEDWVSRSGVRDAGLGSVSLSTPIPFNNGLNDGLDSRDFPAPKLQIELEFDLQLDRSARVLLNPKLDEERGDPFPDRKEVVDLGVAGGTDRNKKGMAVVPGLPVVDSDPLV